MVNDGVFLYRFRHMSFVFSKYLWAIVLYMAYTSDELITKNFFAWLTQISLGTHTTTFIRICDVGLNTKSRLTTPSLAHL